MSVTAIGWLANVFPLLYVVLAVPAGLALDRRPGPALGWGVALTAVGGVVRLGGDSFGWALAGQLLVAVAQPFVLNAITGVVAVLPERSRPTGIAIGSGGLFLGMVVALGAGAAVGGDHLVALMVGEAVVAVAAAAAFLVVAALRPGSRRGRCPASPATCARCGPTRCCGGSRCSPSWASGCSSRLVTWLQALLEPRGVSESEAGTIITVAVAVGAVGSMVVAAVFEDRGVEVLLLRLALVAAVVGCVLLAVASGVAVATVGAVLAVLALLTALPWLLSLCERRADDSVASATALLWLAGNLGGLLVAVVVGALVDYPAAAFLLMAAVALGALPLVRGRALGLES